MKKQSTIKPRIILGVTGSLGSGKSTVARILGGFLRARVINADRLAHRVLRQERGCYRKIIRCFGSGIVGKNGLIDRERLAERVFTDREALQQLNSITHPQIICQIKSELRRFKNRNIIVDAPLLIESGFHHYVDKVVLVKASRRNTLLRLNAGSRCEALRRLKFQMPQRRKLRLADFVIDNNGTLADTRKQIKQVYRSLAPALRRGSGSTFITR